MTEPLEDPEPPMWPEHHRALPRMLAFTRELLQYPAVDSNEAHAFELFAWYYDETELFDRSLGCPVHYETGFAVYVSEEQRRAGTAHATWLIGEVTRWALQLLVDEETAMRLRRAACEAHQRRGR